MKRIIGLIPVLLCVACSKPDDVMPDIEKVVPEVIACSMDDGADNVSVKAGEIELTFDVSVRVKDASAITMTGAVLKVTGLDTGYYSGRCFV